MIVVAMFAAAGVLVALAWLLGFKATPRLADADEARAVAAAALYGFNATTVALDADHAGATLRGDDGRRVRIVPLGDRWVVRAG